jgi:membrane-associated phospholipid phosphatase
MFSPTHEGVPLLGRLVKQKVYNGAWMLVRTTWVHVAFGTILAAGTALPGTARAADPHELRVDVPVDGAIAAGGAAVWIASELLKSSLAPLTCRWCEVPGIDSSVRDALRSKDTGVVDTASNVVGFVVMPLTTVGLTALGANAEGRGGNVPKDALVIAEAAIIAADVNQLTKLIIGRERPFVHALPDDQKSQTAQPPDNNLSFFSGHTTLAFTLATASGTVASMRHYDAAPAVWGVGMSLAVLTGYLRIAADKHHFTDVVSGAVVGSAIGFALPYVFHRPRADVSLAPMTGTGGLSSATISGTF